MKHIPQRTCIGCMQSKSQNELLRIVKNNKQEVFIDLSKKSNGRGAYICKNIDCLEKAIKTKKLERCFKIKINNQIYESLRGVIIDK